MSRFDARDQTGVTALRILAIDQVEQARSGHPGLPLGAAPMAYALWRRHLRFDPSSPTWADRDRFVLSAGHGSALLYALLHLFGFDLPLDELRRFRQLGSRTPGHPEYGLTPGVETTTGPLGQGLAAAVGMALAERHLASRFNRPGFEVVNHRTWVIASDGDLMEGISHEAASLAGHLRLGRLVVLYDDNRITIEGSTELAFSEDVEARFAASGWRTLHVEDGNDLEAISSALDEAAGGEDRPVLIRVRTHIGYGSPKQDSAAVHGSPLGPEAWRATRAAFGWTHEPFVIPEEVRATFRAAGAAGAAARQAWMESLSRYRETYPDLAAELERRLRSELPAGWDAALPAFDNATPLATREASGKVLNAFAPRVPELVGGSADLAPSNNTLLAGESDLAAGAWGGRNMHFGIREHAMAAIANGMALHGGVRPYVATFLTFADYLRPSLRLAALMKLPVTYVFTHDSVLLGEDGPTHQPVEHTVSLRIVPNLVTLRPADARETAEAWRVALARRDGPTALLLSRQKLPVLPPPAPGAVARGAFVRAEASGGEPEAVLIATGSEVSTCLEARERLEGVGVPTRVVSAPSLELLARQDEAYRRTVLGPASALRVAVELGRGQGWHRWVGDGETVVLSRFGESGKPEDLARHFAFTSEAIAERVLQALRARRAAPIELALPPASAAAASAARQRLVDGAVIERLVARDGALFGDRHAGNVGKRLGWLDLPARSGAVLPALRRLVNGLAGDGVDTLYLLGMGGSSLGPEVLRAIAGSPSGRRLVVADTTDADRAAAMLDGFEPARSAVLAVSKSGTTAETAALLAILAARLREALGGGASRRLVALTEPNTALAHTARSQGWRAVVPHPVDVGGRFSILCAVGLLPALWLGIDADAFLAEGAYALSGLDVDHPGVRLGCQMAAACGEGWGKLAWCASPALRPFGMWAEQLVAESTGKEKHGILPVIVADPSAMPAWPHTLVLSPRFADEDVAALDAALDRLVSRGVPVVRWKLGRHQLAQLFVGLEIATAVAGWLLGVNPFDEPDVVRAKDRARAALAAGHHEYPAATPEPAAALAAFLEGIGADDAIVLLGWLPESAESAAALERLAERLAARHGVPVTTGFGPRYLHSTGQLHKGAPDRLRVVLLSGEPSRDVPIPGQTHTIGQLRWAQALGDLAALRDVARPVVHLHLGQGAVEALASLGS
ncbi:MAG TPA: transketolase [Thermoanaerobaculaceae bacterium]|nr:transketolase [Thermoanaerobaculaceae bacterium]HRS15772.1 transketolase [Thermoanaerobaculaceae bacterium]